ncbi:MAG: TolB-like protein, partial [Acidimicrobiales bacterium]|nr:TolB-like protein [Acidimicrobiales bacterium]
TNQQWDVYRRDRLGSTTARVSLTNADKQLTGHAELCGASRNGRFFGFGSNSSGGYQLYRRDIQKGTTTIVSVSSSEVPASRPGGTGIAPDWNCPISDDGRYVAFQAEATNLVAADADVDDDVFRRDLQLGTTQLISQSSGNVPGDSGSGDAAMSADGGTIAFASAATNLVSADSNGVQDLFVRTPSTSTTTRVSVKANGTQLSDSSSDPALSADGNLVAFDSYATGLMSSDTNNDRDVFVRNRTTGTITVATLNSQGIQGDSSSVDPIISDDGRYVTFTSTSTNFAPGGVAGDDDQFRRDLQTGTTQLASRTVSGATPHDGSYGDSMSADGSVVVFASEADNFVRGDANGQKDIFVRDFDDDILPFAGLDHLIDTQFQDFAARTPTVAEDTEWNARLVNGEVSPDGVVNAMAHAPAWAAKRAPLIRLYWAFFLRSPDIGGLDHWTGKLQHGASLASVASQFAKSSEFQTNYGSLSNEAFVTAIYHNIFDRDPDATGLAYWTKRLDTKAKTRGDVMVNFSESSEGKRMLKGQTDILLIWVGMLGTRPPDPVMSDLRLALADGEPPEFVSRHIRTLAAYAAHVS